MVELLTTKIEGKLRGIRAGRLTPETSEIGKYLNKLATINEGLHEELLAAYVIALKEYKKLTDKN